MKEWLDEEQFLQGVGSLKTRLCSLKFERTGLPTMKWLHVNFPTCSDIEINCKHLHFSSGITLTCIKYEDSQECCSHDIYIYYVALVMYMLG